MDFVYMRNLKNKNNACSKFSELNRKQATRVYYYRLTRRPKCAIIYIVRSLLSCWLWDFPIIMDVDLESSNPSTPTTTKTDCLFCSPCFLFSDIHEPYQKQRNRHRSRFLSVIRVSADDYGCGVPEFAGETIPSAASF